MKKSLLKLFILFPLLLGSFLKANAQFPYTESFTNPTADGMSYGGSAFLTAETGSRQIDQPGNGVLRLTSNTNNQNGYAISNRSFPSANGLKIEFEYFMYGHNGVAADGLSFFLFDAATSSFNIGGFGGSLGYAPSGTSRGLSNAYIGIGIDSYGNFSNPSEGRQTGPGSLSSAISIRGKGNGFSGDPENYKYITGAQTGQYGFDVQTGGRRTEQEWGYRKVFIELKPNPDASEGGYFISVTLQAQESFGTRVRKIIDNVPYFIKAPENLRFGFAASTGYFFNNHEIKNLKVDLYNPLPPKYPYIESFKNASAAGMSYGGSAFLTAAAGSSQIDQPGSGTLRLTSNTNNQNGYAVSNVSFPSANGLKIEFEYFMYGHNGIAADGLSFFLFDAATSSFNIGGFGGSLGYAPSGSGKGVSNGYLGIGIDAYGNYSNPTDGRQTGPGTLSNAISIRGKGNGTAGDPENYKYITGAQTGQYGFDVQTGGRRTAQEWGYRKVFIELKPNPDTVTGGYLISLTIQAQESFGTRVQKIIDEVPYFVKAPENLRFGFAASTGYFFNNHEIQNLKVDLYTPSTETDQRIPSFLDFPELAQKSVSDSAFAINVTSSNHETPIVLTSSDPETVELENISGIWKATIKKGGTVQITASQNGNIHYFPASIVTRDLLVVAPAETSVINFAELSPKYIADGEFTLNVSSNNTQTPIVVSSSNPAIASVAKVNGVWKATLLQQGTVQLTASQAGNINYTAAANVVRSLVINANQAGAVSFPYYETFKYSAANGMATGGSAFITAATGPQKIDQEGTGALRLTSNTQNQSGYAISNMSVPSAKGLKIEFEYSMYGSGGVGADGLSFFLFDAATSAFNIGGFGGSLGYAPLNDKPGLSNAYLGVAFDAFGNFSNAQNGRLSGPGTLSSAVSLRGKGNGLSSDSENYKYITSATTGNYGFNVQTGGRRTPQEWGYRKVLIDLKPNPDTVAGGYFISVTIQAQESFGTRIQKIIDEVPYFVKAPENLRFGFAASTGDYFNIHEINNLKVEPFSGTVIPQEKISSFLDFPYLVKKTTKDTVFTVNVSSSNKETPVVLSSSDPQTLTLADSAGVWKATVLKKGSVTITASQAGNENYFPATTISRIQVVGLPSERIPFSYVTPSTVSPYNYTPWLSNDTTKVNFVYSSETDNNYNDVTLWLSQKALVTKISLLKNKYFSGYNPALIYTINGTDTTFAGNFISDRDLDLSLDTIAAEGILIRHKANVFPYKIQAYGIVEVPDTVVVRNRVAVLNFPELPVRTIEGEVYDLTASSNNAESPITFTSSNPAVISISQTGNAWKAKVLRNGTATITAKQKANGSYLPPIPVSRNQAAVLATYFLDSSITSPKIPLDAKRWYYNNENLKLPGLAQMFNGITEYSISTNGNGRPINRYEGYYPLRSGETMEIDAIRFFDNQAIENGDTMKLSVITDTWQRIPIATFTSHASNDWVGPYPSRNGLFKLDTVIKNARYLLIDCDWVMPTEIELYGKYTAGIAPTAAVKRHPKLRDMFGVNAWEWNFYNQATYSIDSNVVKPMRTFSAMRHYTEWARIEKRKGEYTFTPEEQGWDLDQIFTASTNEGIDVLACVKGVPEYIQVTYPVGKRTGEDVPAPYGSNLMDPMSYLDQAKLAFQFAARYGSNLNVNPALVKGGKPETFWLPATLPKIGMGVVKYLECDNERNKSWKGRNAYQTGREYAANMSAFYDGHKNTMGPGVGAKNADPNMKVIMNGIASEFTDYIRGMVDWCKEFRGYNADGSVNLCWDVSNYHQYMSDDWAGYFADIYHHHSKGIAPELSNAAEVANNFIQMSHEDANNIETWVTEVGYDAPYGGTSWSPIQTFPIGNKTSHDVKADWILRTALMYAREGISKTFFYATVDVNAGEIFSASHLIKDNKRVPAGDFIYQTYKKFGDYTFSETLNRNPFVDKYQYNDKIMYSLVVPDQVDRKVNYTLSLGNVDSAYIYHPVALQDTFSVEKVKVTNGQLEVLVTETPMFVQGIERPIVLNAFTWTGSLSTEMDSVQNWKHSVSGLSLALPDSASVITIPSGLAKYPVMQANFAYRDITIADSASLNLNGYQLSVSGNIKNYGKLIYNNNLSSAIRFNGTDSLQTFAGNTQAGSSQVGRILVDNPNGLNLTGGNIDVYKAVNITKGVLNANGNLTLKASATNTAGVGRIPAGSSVNGNVNVEIFITGGPSSYRGTRGLSTPVNDQLISGQKSLEQLKNYVVITGPGGATNGFDPGGSASPYAVSLQRYYEPANLSQSQFTNVNNIYEPLLPGTGVFLYYRGDRSGYTPATAATSNKVNSPYALPENTVVKYTGPLNQGDIPVNLSYTNDSTDTNRGFNYVGNPYACPINWDLISKNEMQDMIKVIKPGGGIATYSNGVTTNAGTMNMKLIQPGLAFYVQAKNASGVITFNEACKVTDSVLTARFLYAAERYPLGSLIGSTTRAESQILRISLSGNQSTEEAAIVFGRGNSTSYRVSDGDASYIKSTDVSLSSLTSDNKKMAINFMPETDAVNEIKLNVDAISSGRMTINFDELPAKAKFVLKDNCLKTETVVEQGTAYSFDIDKTNNRSFGEDRFLLVLRDGEPEGNPIVNSEILIYPNPASNILNISIAKLKAKSAIATVYNPAGIAVAEKTISDDNLALDISKLPSGVYVIKLKDTQTGKEIITSKFVKD